MKKSTATLRWDDTYTTKIETRQHVLTADEPKELEGLDAGATPGEMLMSALAACTAITIKMYAKRKDWTFDSIEVNVEDHEDAEEGEARFVKTLSFSGHNLDEKSLEKLLAISEKCPVNKLLNAGAKTSTKLA